MSTTRPEVMRFYVVMNDFEDGTHDEESPHGRCVLYTDYEKCEATIKRLRELLDECAGYAEEHNDAPAFVIKIDAALTEEGS